MEFNKERVYTSLNADELRAGDKVIVANSMADLKTSVQSDYKVREILFIHNDTNLARFEVKGWGDSSYIAALAYLVERAENCGNCCVACRGKAPFRLNRCKDWKLNTEQKAEPHYRPFRDTDELIKVWGEKIGSTDYWGKGADLTMPHIWVRYKKEEGSKSKGHLIHGFYEDIIEIQDRTMSMEDLFYFCEFLDGSPCGVKEEA